MRHGTVYFHDHLMTAGAGAGGAALFVHALTYPPVLGAFLHFVMSKHKTTIKKIASNHLHENCTD